MPEEILDLVDDQDQVIGQIAREKTHGGQIQNYRVVHGFLRNGQGELWIPRRTPTKKIAPNALDFSVAGHVETGETYDQCFIRETAEELNLGLQNIPWKQLGKLTPADGVNCFQMVYEIQADLTPNFNPDDFTEAWWLSPEQVIARIDGGDLAKSALKLTVQKFYLS